MFMVNSFVRPTDIRNMQHKHVDVVRADHTYLRLRLPTSKRHSDPITTMPRAVFVYERILVRHLAEGRVLTADDYVFAPEWTNRAHAMKEFQRQFDLLLEETGLRWGATGDARTMYSLRHTSIMYRLMYGERIDTITLAKNARTSVEMISRFYASQLQAEQNIDMLQSRRKRKPRSVIG